MKFLRLTRRVLILALVVAVSGCGKSEQEKQQEEAKKQIEAAQKQLEEAGKKAAEAAGKAGEAAGTAGEAAGKAGAVAATEAAKGLEAFAKGLQGLAATGPDGKPVTPVNFHELQTTFVALDGWEMGKPTGSQMSSPVSYSTAEVVYHKGDARITVSVMDSGFSQLLIGPFTMYLTSGYEKETENGYEKSVKVAGNPGWEKWDSQDKRGEVAAFVGKRFVVNFKGNGIDNTKVLYQLADASNLTKLAGMK
jgi:hypothetical protein